jgi:hypothetical protein
MLRVKMDALAYLLAAFWAGSPWRSRLRTKARPFFVLLRVISGERC